jgi:hypothetical protein
MQSCHANQVRLKIRQLASTAKPNRCPLSKTFRTVAAALNKVFDQVDLAAVRRFGGTLGTIIQAELGLFRRQNAAAGIGILSMRESLETPRILEPDHAAIELMDRTPGSGHARTRFARRLVGLSR